MSSVATAVPMPDQEPLLHRLLAVVRPEFRDEVIHIDVDNPVFARGRCRVAGCDRGAWARLLCNSHYTRWRLHGRPDIDAFAASAGPVREKPGSELVDTFDLRGLPMPLRLEIAYSIQCRHDDRTVRLIPTMIGGLVKLVRTVNVDSLLDRSLEDWLADAATLGLVDTGGRKVGQLRYAWRRIRDLAEGTDAESEFARDVWRASVLGIPQARPPHQIRFDGLSQPWLRAAVKRSCRFRLGAGQAFGTVSIDERALRWFSRFLATEHPDVKDASDLTRDILEHYLSWLTTSSLGKNTTNTYLVVLRSFLDACRRHRWLPGLGGDAALYLDELPARARPLPRFIAEYLMAQLEDPANLARLPDDTTRHLVILIMETGLRANDACALPFNPLINDSSGWPCLKFYNAKMAAEQLVPLSQAGAEAVHAQQAHLRHRWPDAAPPRLFPSPHCNPAGARPFNYATLRTRLASWQDQIGLLDEAGQRVHVTAHQFRHTLGTRLINDGVPQHVVQRLLGHASPQMTARYASIHDTTVRAAFDDYQRRRVNIHGERIDFDPEAPTADAEWIKHNLARVQATLPNGYCGRPPQQSCPHPNACLTCPDFQTTPAFLPLHRRQRDDTLELIDLAERNGNLRLGENHRQVAANLDRVIHALEHVQDQESVDADR